MTGTQAHHQGNSRTRFIRLLGITTMLAGLASPALAADDQATAAAEEEKGFEEIIVTATRTATSIQKVPISMQALSADTLQQRSVKGLTDFAQLIPSVSFAGLGPGRTEVYFRGIVPAGGAYPATGYYLDDISINVNGLPDVHIYDVERIEALSGPQGTLFGAGSLAGTIRVITNKPKLGEFSGGMDLEANKFGKGDFGGQAQATITGHIGDFELVSATGYFRRNIKLLNDYTYYTVAYDTFGGGYESYLQFFDKAGCTGSGASLRCTTLLNPQQYYSGNRNERIFTQEIRLKTPSSWPVDITVGGFYQYQKNEINDNYATRGLGEVGGYTDRCAYSVTPDDCEGNELNLDGFGIPVSQGGTLIPGTPAVKGEAFYLAEQNRVTRDYAVFAEGHYNITPTLKITGGIRYFWTELNLVGFAGVAASAQNVRSTVAATGQAGGCPTPLSATERLTCLNTNFTRPDHQLIYREQGETHKVALDWQVAPGKMIYANYSTGFRPGGQGRPLRIGGQVYAVAPFRSEDLTNFEIGFKTTWNNIFRFNAAIYLEKWNDLQYGVVVAGAQGAGITGNAGNAEIMGIEFDADLRLGKFTISSSGAYNDGKLKGDFCNFRRNDANLTIEQAPTCVNGQFFDGNPPTPQVAAADGTRLPRQPKFKGTTQVRYDTTFSKMDFYVQGAANYQTGATQDLNTDLNDLLGNSAGFVSFDFSAGIKKDKWTVDLYIQNAFDRRGILTTNTFCSISICSGSSRNFPIRPQFFGVKFGQRF